MRSVSLAWASGGEGGRWSDQGVAAFWLSRELWLCFCAKRSHWWALSREDAFGLRPKRLMLAAPGVLEHGRARTRELCQGHGTGLAHSV